LGGLPLGEIRIAKLTKAWPNSPREVARQTWAEKAASANVVMVLEKDLERTKNLTEPIQPITLHIVKNRRGERGQLVFDF
jgi:hypothetical protein